MSTMEFPDDLGYTTDHEWVRSCDENVVRVGVTAYAQDALGDIVYVTLPTVGTAVSEGDSVGEVESTKSVSDIYSPVTGTVRARNDALETSPELVNSAPYGDGWIFEVSLAEGDEGPDLLDAAEYQKELD